MKTPFLFLIALIGLTFLSCKSSGTEEQASTQDLTPTETPSGIAYTVDIPRTELKWTGFKPTGTHYGIVPIESGTVYVDGDIITGGEVRINMSGLQLLDAEGAKRDKIEGHLKGTIEGKEDDFFNVQKFPTATFTILGSEKLENDPLGTHQINGALTLKDITHPVSFKAVVDLSSGVAMKATAEPFVIDRSKWDVRFKSRSFYDDLKDDFINDEIRLELIVGALKS